MRTFRRRLVGTLLLTSLFSFGCGEVGQPLPDLKGGAEIGLKRGSNWTTFTVKPPYFIGPRGSLKIQKNVMRGSLSSASFAGGNQVEINIENGGLSGRIAGFSVELEISGDSDKVEVSGLWLGKRVHFVFAPDGIRGSLVTLEAGQCQFTIDRMGPDGARLGQSTCIGLPEETRLELPRELQAWLTRDEFVAVMLIVFSVPPVTRMETVPQLR